MEENIADFACVDYAGWEAIGEKSSGGAEGGLLKVLGGKVESVEGGGWL